MKAAIYARGPSEGEGAGYETRRPRAVVPLQRVQGVIGLPLGDAALTLGVSRSTLKRWRRQVQQSPSA